MPDETVETRRPWRGSPRPCVHAGAFLRLVGIISTVSKPLRYALRREDVCARGTRGLRSLRCGEFALRLVTPAMCHHTANANKKYQPLQNVLQMIIIGILDL